MTGRMTLEDSPMSQPLHSMKIRYDGPGKADGYRLQSIGSAGFGMTRTGGTRPHHGVDLAAKPGTPVLAIANGIIERVRHGVKGYGTEVVLKFRPTSGWLRHFASLGNADGDGVLYAQYAHLGLVTVAAGAQIRRCQVIAATGATGSAQKYPHMHFEMRKVSWPKQGQAGLADRIDPLSIFKVDYVDALEGLEEISRTA